MSVNFCSRDIEFIPIFGHMGALWYDLAFFAEISQIYHMDDIEIYYIAILLYSTYTRLTF